MKHFEFEIDTIGGIADADFLDRLAEVVYSVDALIDPLLGLNGDGSISASFVVAATDALSATKIAADEFSDAIVAARPLREPTDAEVADREAQVGRFEVRETVYA